VQVVENENQWTVTVTGSLTFLGIPSLIRQLEALPSSKTVQLILDIDHLDHASLEAIRSWKEGYEKTGGKVLKERLDKLWKDLGSGSNGSSSSANRKGLLNASVVHGEGEPSSSTSH
jgi:carbonic anhydrase